MRNEEIAATFNTIGDMLEIKGENRFKVNAYKDAARHIEEMSDELSAVAAAGGLRSIPGVGQAISAKIQELLDTGHLTYLDELRLEIPESLVELLQVPGLGPRKVKQLHETLQVASVADLRVAIAEGKLATMAGMGARTVTNLQRELERWEQRGARTALGTALPLVLDIIAQLQACCPGLINAISEAGSIRRRRDTIGDLDVLVASERPAPILEAFATLPLVQEVIARGETKVSILGPRHQQVDLRVVPTSSWGAALQYFTGSKPHNVRIRELAVRKGLRLNEYELADVATGQRRASVDEAEVYAALGLPWIPPEIREDSGEIEAALAGRLPRLIEVGDIIGELHSHSNWSDGDCEIEEIWRAARERGLTYLGLTDHSQSLGVASGLSVERLYQQWEIVDAINARGEGPRILKGVELEIRADGSLDFPDEVLERLDLVIASVHSSFGQPRDKMTARIIAAARSPHVDVIGHPTGRLIGQREGYDVDLEALIDACAQSGTALEINAHPSRLDLDDVHARHAHEKGVWLAIDTDAHAPDNFDLLSYGVATARRAWVEPRHVLNCLSLEDLLKHLAAHGKSVARAG